MFLWLQKSQAKLYLNFSKDIASNDRFIEADVVIENDEIDEFDRSIIKYRIYRVGKQFESVSEASRSECNELPI